MGFGDFDINAMQSELRNQRDIRERLPVKETPAEDMESEQEIETTPDAKYRDATELEREISGNDTGIIESDTVEIPKTKPKPVKKKQAGRKANNDSDLMFIRDFPKALVAIARAEFPSATSASSALAAYVYVKSGRQCDVPDSVKELAKDYDGEKSIENLSTQMDVIYKKVLEFTKLLHSVELLTAFQLFDRLGFRKESPKTPRSVDLLEQDGAYDLIKRAAEQSNELLKEIAIRDGRPIR